MSWVAFVLRGGSPPLGSARMTTMTIFHGVVASVFVSVCFHWHVPWAAHLSLSCFCFKLYVCIPWKERLQQKVLGNCVGTQHSISHGREEECGEVLRLGTCAGSEASQEARLLPWSLAGWGDFPGRPPKASELDLFWLLCSPEGDMQLQPVWNCSRMTGTIQASHPLKCSRFAGRSKDTRYSCKQSRGKISAQQQESSFPLQSQDTMPFFTSLSVTPPGTHHTRGVLVSKDDIAATLVSQKLQLLFQPHLPSKLVFGVTWQNLRPWKRTRAEGV